jgi:hypothetical protein
MITSSGLGTIDDILVLKPFGIGYNVKLSQNFLNKKPRVLKTLIGPRPVYLSP